MTRPLIASFALVLLLLIANASGASERTPNPPRPGDASGHNYQSRHQDKRTEKPSAFQNAPPPNLQEEPRQSYSDFQEKVTDPIVFINLLLLVILAYQSVLFRRTAAATKKYADVAEDTARRQLRAYVTVKEARLTWPAPLQPLVAVLIRNTGQTPAYNLTSSVGIFVAQYPLSGEFVWGKDSPDVSTSIIGSQQEITLETSDTLPQESVAALKTGQYAVYVRGECLYDDAFGQSRFTRFYLIYHATDRVLSGPLSSMAAGNEAN